VSLFASQPSHVDQVTYFCDLLRSTNHARGYRAIGLPFIAFGTAVMVMAVKRICGVIWLL
jgi:hypothetical protein